MINIIILILGHVLILIFILMRILIRIIRIWILSMLTIRVRLMPSMIRRCSVLTRTRLLSLFRKMRALMITLTRMIMRTLALARALVIVRAIIRMMMSMLRKRISARKSAWACSS